MSNNQQHIPNETDTILAKKLSKYLDGSASKSSINDPLFSKLEIAKNVEIRKQDSIAVQGQESVWSSIITIIESAQTKSRRSFVFTSSRISNWYSLAVAAAVIMAFTTILWYQFGSTGPEIIAGRSSEVQLVTLSDGSTVTLRPNSELLYTENQENTVNVVLSGEAVFDVVSNPNRVFYVETINSRIVVTGTRFNVRSSQSKSSVYLLEGAVTFESVDASQSVVLNPGEASEMDHNGIISQPFIFEEDVVLSWTKSRLTLTNRSLSSVVEELELHFDVEIQIPDSLAVEILGGSVSLESIDETLNDLGIVLGGSFKVSESGVYRFESDS